MKRFATACVLLAATLPLTGCFGGGGSDKSSNASASSTASASNPVTITAWVGWSAATHELKEFKRLVAEYDAKHPEVDVLILDDGLQSNAGPM